MSRAGRGSVALAGAALWLASACGAKTGLRIDRARGDAGPPSDAAPDDGDAGSSMDGSIPPDDGATTDGPAGDGTVLGDGAVMDGTADGATTFGDGGVLGPFSAVAAGAYHSCALRSTGEVYCWGRNDDWQVGVVDTHIQRSPRRVRGVLATEVTLGARHTCALEAGGVVKCWGSNGWGMLGRGESAGSPSPWPVPGLPSVSHVAAGWSHTCALTVSGEVLCWGKNDGGQIGNGTTVDQHVPTRVLALDSAVGVSVGRAHSCAVTRDGSVRCWGSNPDGRRGVAGDGNALRALLVPGLAPSRAVYAGEGHTCALGRDRRLRCWGRYRASSSLATCDEMRRMACEAGGCDVPHRLPNLPLEVPRARGVRSAATGGGHACLIDRRGALYCWGSNVERELGFEPSGRCEAWSCSDIDPCLEPVPVAVPGIGTVRAVAAGQQHTCAVDRLHHVYCWGSNEFGQAGGPDPSVSRPRRVAGL